MNRRNMLWSALSGLGATLGASSAKAATNAGTGNKLKVVYHLSDAEKVNFVLGNIQNHIERRRRSRPCDDRAGDPRAGAEGVSFGAGQS